MNRSFISPRRSAVILSALLGSFALLGLVASPAAGQEISIRPEAPTRHTAISVRADFPAGPYVETSGYEITGDTVEVSFYQDGVDLSPNPPFSAFVQVPPLAAGEWTFEISIDDVVAEVVTVEVAEGTPLGVLGIADPVPAATLLVPFVEVGATAESAQDTRMVVYNTAPYGLLVRYQLWNVYGVAVPGLAGHVDLASGETWSDSARRLIEVATEADRELLLDGDFFRGFATIDVVEAETDLAPLDPSYPFAHDNRLLGYIYYTRLAEGSANGLAMVSIESVPTGVSPNDLPFAVTGFYGELQCVILCAPDFAQGRREQLGLRGRACAAEATQGEPQTSGACQSVKPGAILRSRLFASDALVASSRTIVFSWLPDWQGAAPTPVCDLNPGFPDCERDFAYVRRREDGSVAESGRLELPRVVNIIESTGDLRPGELLIEVAPSGLATQWYVFSFNSAQLPGMPGVHWDAIFEGSVEVLP